MAVVAGWADTRAALARWNRAPGRTLGEWVMVSAGVSFGLLLVTWALGQHVVVDPAMRLPQSFSRDPSLGAAGAIFARNSLVLAMHALICLAGYIATSSLPLAAQSYSGFTRRLHVIMRPVTLVFVTIAAAGSLAMQAWSLGHVAPLVAAAYDVRVGRLLVLIMPHAVPELTAIFLPLGAWIMLAHRKRWSELLAASMVTVVVSVPVLAMSALVEEYVTPLLVLGAG